MQTLSILLSTSLTSTEVTSQTIFQQSKMPPSRIRARPACKSTRRWHIVAGASMAAFDSTWADPSRSIFRTTNTEPKKLHSVRGFAAEAVLVRNMLAAKQRQLPPITLKVLSPHELVRRSLALNDVVIDDELRNIR